MEITGRLTDDAEIRKTKNNKEVVTFSLAVNDQYKPKDGDLIKYTEYFSCAYWLSTSVVQALRRSSIVTVTGRVYLNQYTNKSGDNHANIAVHVNGIKVLSAPKKGTESRQDVPANNADGSPTTVDDLPF